MNMSALSFFPPSNRRRCVKGRPSYIEPSDNLVSSLAVNNNFCIDDFNQNEYSSHDPVETDDVDEEPITIDLSAFLNENPLLAQSAFECSAENNVASTESSSQFRVTDCEIKSSEISNAEISKNDFSVVSSTTNINDSILDNSTTSVFVSDTLSNVNTSVKENCVTEQNNFSSLLYDSNDNIKENCLNNHDNLQSIAVHNESVKGISVTSKRNHLKKFSRVKPLGLSNPLKKYKNFMKIKDLNKTSMKVLGKYPIVKCEKLDIEDFVKNNSIKVSNWPLNHVVKNQKNKSFISKPNIANRKISLTKAVMKPKVRKPISFSQYIKKSSNETASSKLGSILVDSFDAMNTMSNPLIIKTNNWKPEITKTSTPLPKFFKSPAKKPPIIPKSPATTILKHNSFKSNANQVSSYNTISSQKPVKKRSGPIITSVNKVNNIPKAFKLIAPKPVVKPEEIVNILPNFTKSIIETVAEPILNDYTVIEPYVEDPTSPLKSEPVIFPVEVILSPEKQSLLLPDAIVNDNLENEENSKNAKLDFFNGAIQQISIPSRSKKAISLTKKEVLAKQRFNRESILNRSTKTSMIINGKYEENDVCSSVLKAKNAVVDAMQSVFTSVHKIKKPKPKFVKKELDLNLSAVAPDSSSTYSSTLNDLFFGFSENDFEDLTFNTENENNTRSYFESISGHNFITPNVTPSNKIGNSTFDKSITESKKKTFNNDSHTSDTLSASECENENNHAKQKRTKKKSRKTTNISFETADVMPVSNKIIQSEKINNNSTDDVGNLNCLDINKSFNNKSTDSSYSFSSFESPGELISDNKIKPTLNHINGKESEIFDSAIKESARNRNKRNLKENANPVLPKISTRALRVRKCSNVEVDKFSDNSVNISTGSKKCIPGRSFKQVKGSINSKLKIQMKTPPRTTAKVKIKQKSSKPEDIIQEINTITGGNIKKKTIRNVKDKNQSDCDKVVKNSNLSRAKDEDSESNNFVSLAKSSHAFSKKKKTLKVCIIRSKRKPRTSSLKKKLNSLSDVENSYSPSSVSENNENLHSSFRKGNTENMESPSKEESAPENNICVSENIMEDIETCEMIAEKSPMISDVKEDSLVNLSEIPVWKESMSDVHSDSNSAIPNSPSFNESQDINLIPNLFDKSSQDYISKETSLIRTSESEDSSLVSDANIKNKLDILNVTENNTEDNILSDKMVESSEEISIKNLTISLLDHVVDTIERNKGMAVENNFVSQNDLSETTDISIDKNYEVSAKVGNDSSKIAINLDDVENTNIVTQTHNSGIYELLPTNSEKNNVITEIDNSVIIDTTISCTSEKIDIIEANNFSFESVGIPDNSEKNDTLAETENCEMHNSKLLANPQNNNILAEQSNNETSASEMDKKENENTDHQEIMDNQSKSLIDKHNLSNTIEFTDNSSSIDNFVAVDSISDKTMFISDSPENSNKNSNVMDHRSSLNEISVNNNVPSKFVNDIDSEQSINISQNISVTDGTSESNGRNRKKKCPKLKISIKNSKESNQDSLKNWYISETKLSDEEISVQPTILESNSSKCININAEKFPSNSVPCSLASMEDPISNISMKNPQSCSISEKIVGSNTATVNSEISTTSNVELKKDGGVSIENDEEKTMDYDENMEKDISSECPDSSKECAIKIETEVKSTRKSHEKHKISFADKSPRKRKKVDKPVPEKPISESTKSKGKKKQFTPISTSTIGKKKNYVPELVIVPFSMGWMREHVIRASVREDKRASDVYYFAPDGTKLRSVPDILLYLSKHPDINLSRENFTFAKELIYRQPFEIERGAKQPWKKATPNNKIPSNATGSKKKATVQETVSSKVTSPPLSPKKKLKVKNSLKQSTSSISSKSDKSATDSGLSNTSKQNTTNLDIESSGKNSPRPSRHIIKKVPFDNSDESKQFKKLKSTTSQKSDNDKLPKLLTDVNKSELPQEKPSSNILGNLPSVSPAQTNKSILIQKRLKVKLAPRKSNQVVLQKPCTRFCNFAYARVPSVKCTICLCLFHAECIPFVPAPDKVYACAPCVTNHIDSFKDEDLELHTPDIETEILYPIDSLYIQSNHDFIAAYNKFVSPADLSYHQPYMNDVNSCETWCKSIPYPLITSETDEYYKNKTKVCQRLHKPDVRHLPSPVDGLVPLNQLQTFVASSNLRTYSNISNVNPNSSIASNYCFPYAINTSCKILEDSLPLQHQTIVPQMGVTNNSVFASTSCRHKTQFSYPENFKNTSNIFPGNVLSDEITVSTKKSTEIYSDTNNQAVNCSESSGSVLQTLLQDKITNNYSGKEINSNFPSNSFTHDVYLKNDKLNDFQNASVNSMFSPIIPDATNFKSNSNALLQKSTNSAINQNVYTSCGLWPFGNMQNVSDVSNNPFHRQRNEVKHFHSKGLYPFNPMLFNQPPNPTCQQILPHSVCSFVNNSSDLISNLGKRKSFSPSYLQDCSHSAQAKKSKVLEQMYLDNSLEIYNSVTNTLRQSSNYIEHTGLRTKNSYLHDWLPVKLDDTLLPANSYKNSVHQKPNFLQQLTPMHLSKNSVKSIDVHALKDTKEYKKYTQMQSLTSGTVSTNDCSKYSFKEHKNQHSHSLQQQVSELIEKESSSQVTNSLREDTSQPAVDLRGESLQGTHDFQDETKENTNCSEQLLPIHHTTDTNDFTASDSIKQDYISLDANLSMNLPAKKDVLSDASTSSATENHVSLQLLSLNHLMTSDKFSTDIQQDSIAQDPICSECPSTSHLSHVSRISESLCIVFKTLNPYDLLCVSLVCRSWKELAMQKYLWEKVCFSGLTITNWSKCCSFLKKYGTKSIDMRGIFNEQSVEWWKLFSEHMNKLIDVEELIFETVPPFIVRNITNNLPLLKNLTCYCLTNVFTEPEIWSTSCELELAPLRFLGRLERIKLSCMGGVILNDKPQSVMPYLPNLTHVVLTGFKFHDYRNLECLSQQQQLISLELGDCTNIEPQIYSLLSKMSNLRNLCLQNGGSINDTKMPEAVSKLTKLVNLELMNFQVSCHLHNVLKKMDNLCHFSIWPDNRSEASHVNFNAFSAVISCKNLKSIEWGVLIEDEDAAPEIFEMKDPNKSANDIFTFEEFFQTLVEHFPGRNVVIESFPRNAWSEFCCSRNFL